MSTHRIFISTVTNEFLTCRQRLADDLRFPGVVVETQENIVKLASGRSILRKLDEYIAQCDAVIQLVGLQTSMDGTPALSDAVDDLLVLYPDLPSVLALANTDLRSLSYTQWEAWLAYYHLKKDRPHLKILLATPSDKFLPDNQADPATARAQKLSQAWHAQELRRRARFVEIVFADEKDLSIQILRALRDLLPGQEPEQNIAPSRLVSRHTAADFLGREKELALLDEAWAKESTNVLAFIAWGGVGKTALLARWVQSRFAEKGWKNGQGQPDPLRYFDWTFYDQGTRSDDSTRAGVASVDTFFAAALEFFGDENPTKPGKGARLARLVQAQRSLLVLDGLEPLQYPFNHPQAGQFTDPDLRDLLATLAQRNPGLCLVSSRQHLSDLSGGKASTAPQHDLGELPLDVAVRLLRKLQITGSDADLEQAARDYAGHALTLILLGRFLFTSRGGDIRQRDTIPLAKTNDLRDAQTRNAWHVLEAYEQWLDSPQGRPEDIQALRLTGLFDRPATPDCLAAVRAAPAIPGLTDLLVPLDHDAWNALLRRLHEAQLIQLRFPSNPGNSYAPQLEPREVPVDVHPLIREYFGQQLNQRQPEAFRAAHSRLFDHLCNNTEHQPATLAGLQPLYQAITHGCLAKRQQEACEEVYEKRILRGTDQDGFYSTNYLGAYGADLGAIASFFDEPWTLLSPDLTEPYKAWLLNEAGFRLKTLGRLLEAVEPIRSTVGINVESELWYNAAVAAGNLCDLGVTLGLLDSAVEDGLLAIDYADLSGAAFQMMSKRATVAAALHKAGKMAEARAFFAEAEKMQRQRQPAFQLLYSVQGYEFAELLLDSPERAVWREMQHSGSVNQDSEAAHELLGACAEASHRAWTNMHEHSNLSLTSVALDHLTLARAALYRNMLARDSDSEASELKNLIRLALFSLRTANSLDYLPKALLTAAFYYGTLGGDPSEALRLLDEAQQIAERGPMPLYLADVHLHRARLAGILKQEDRQRFFPGVDPRAELAKARGLIERHGYWRRKEELEDAEAAAVNW